MDSAWSRRRSVMDSIRVFAPATIGNIGPGFDVLGLAITALGDSVEARKTRNGVRIAAITGLNGDIPLDAGQNTAGIAAREVLKLLNADGGVELRIQKS